MNIRILVGAAGAAGLATVLLAGAPAQAACYEAGFDRTPSATASTNPPRVGLDDGDPYIRQTACPPRQLLQDVLERIETD